MHELSVCEALLTQVRSTAEANGASGVGRITVRLGPLSGVEPDLLAQAFTIARNGPMTAQASLVIEPQPVRIRCRDCGNENEVPTNRLLCTACESFRVDLVSGDELLLARVELQGISDPPNPTTDSKASSDHV
ncbi:hydrogenase maturation nickel metallochaperone HypA [Wenzhouxiangella limi]|uniref:Hydrogenase maturation factor HypA n=1 Tax=Wenzhouxiangella limi TaxID=2707351 RepID=A0A845UV38_9GAMM|nr:hydrogenase maturation nickel metallochaperone HypA [Wenzhouxiangella limi]NDY95703.1 hydrogenase maturation nickel metallochaperone HypA [Wenzhouxiangella limi]